MLKEDNKVGRKFRTFSRIYGERKKKYYVQLFFFFILLISSFSYCAVNYYSKLSSSILNPPTFYLFPRSGPSFHRSIRFLPKLVSTACFFFRPVLEHFFVVVKIIDDKKNRK